MAPHGTLDGVRSRRYKSPAASEPESFSVSDEDTAQADIAGDFFGTRLCRAEEARDRR